MVHLSVISLAALSLASLPTAVAVPVDSTSREIASVEFEGTTIHYYNDTVQPHNGLSVPSMTKRTNQCGASTFDPAPAPFASVPRCQVLQDYMYKHGSTIVVRQPGPVQQTRIVWNDACSFGASTTSSIETYIGNSDIGDLIRDGMARWQSGGVVCAQGNMLCFNNGPLIAHQSPVFWALYRGPGV